MTRPKIKTYREGDTYRFAHLKRDGIWLTLHTIDTMPNGAEVHCLTRHPIPEKGDVTHQLLGHPTLTAFMDRTANRRHPASFRHASLYCELYAPGEPASMVKSHLAKGKLDLLRIEAFASVDLPTDTHLLSVQRYAHELGVPFAPWRAKSWDDWAEQDDAEGLVYKNGNLLDWAKRKDLLTADLVVVGTIDGKRANAGLIGSLRVATREGREVASCGGMTRDQRIDMTLEPEGALLGRVVEVAYQYVGSGGRLRHPRFVRWRDDKSADEATQFEDL
jgi:hypothetical protein